MSTVFNGPAGGATGGSSTWKDSKRYLWLIGLVVPFFPALSALTAWLTGSEWGWWFAPVFLYGLLPLADWLIGEDTSNPPDEAVKHLSDDTYYKRCVMWFIPLQFVSFFASMAVLASGELGWVGSIGLLLSIGIVSAVAFNTAHELGHKRQKVSDWLAKLSLAPTAYGHFFVEHTRGHHARVATPEDPASARLGESYYAFLPRTVIGGLKSAWHLEKVRLERQGKSVWHYNNHNLQAWGMTVVLYAGMLLWLGVEVLPWLVINSLYAASLFEIVNYLEHYGLCRKKLPDGRYERCQPEHSWNSNHLVTNLFLYQLQRHSDHHANPTRPYQALRHMENAPQLPSGYAGMVPLAYFPPLWRKVMDAKVMAHYEGDLSKANTGLK